jgi:hypothetical protein
MRLIFLAMGAAVLVSGCMQPRIVKTSTGTNDQIKFLVSDGTTQSILECQRTEDGTLKNCKELPVELND